MGLRVAVLVVLQGVEYGTELPVAGGLEVLQGRGCAGELCQASRQTRAFLGGQDAPGEEAEEIASIGVRVGFEVVIEEVVEALGLRGGKPEVDRGPVVAQRVFST